MEIIKRTLFTGWNFMRLLRLVFGIIFLAQGILMHESIVGVAGGFFLFTALTNTGCCGSVGCTYVPGKNSEKNLEKTEFEEINVK